MSLFQNCICFPDDVSQEFIDNFILNLNITNSSNVISDDKIYPLESIMIFGIIFVMIIIFFII